MRIGLRFYAVEIQVEFGLVDTVKVLQVSECDKLIVTKAIGLIGGKLRRRAATASAAKAQAASIRKRRVRWIFIVSSKMSFVIRASIRRVCYKYWELSVSIGPVPPLAVGISGIPRGRFFLHC
jgi:hypothetical protein